MKQEDKVGMKVHQAYPGDDQVMKDFMNMPPTEFTEKWPKVMVSDANHKPTSHPGYNKYIQDELNKIDAE